jgi:hypothetical protein
MAVRVLDVALRLPLIFAVIVRDHEIEFTDTGRAARREVA